MYQCISVLVYQLIVDLGVMYIEVERQKELWVIISMINATVIIEYDRRRSKLPSAPLDVTFKVDTVCVCTYSNSLFTLQSS